MDKKTENILKEFDCDYEVFKKGIDYRIVEDAYFKARETGKKEGWYPALLVADKYVEEWLCYIQKETPIDKETFLANCSNDGEKLLKERFGEYLEDYYEGEPDGLDGDMEEGQIINSFAGYVSFEAPVTEEEVILFKIPVKNPWEIIAWLPMGGWNECPEPEEMMAIAKYWYEKYGAIPAVFTHDVMEFYLEQPVKEENAMEVAREHYAFCPDRVDQGTETGTISEIAVGLPESHVWYFWWD